MKRIDHGARAPPTPPPARSRRGRPTAVDFNQICHHLGRETTSSLLLFGFLGEVGGSCSSHPLHANELRGAALLLVAAGGA